jgi:aminomethyltransferase
LYGADVDEKTNPFEARLGFVVKLHKNFIGRNKLQEEKQKGPGKLRVGLVMLNRVIPRHGFEISSDQEERGIVTSGTLSPMINKGIAMGYVEKQSASEGTPVDILIRGRHEPARVTKTPFYDTTKYGHTRNIQ